MGTRHWQRPPAASCHAATVAAPVVVVVMVLILVVGVVIHSRRNGSGSGGEEEEEEEEQSTKSISIIIIIIAILHHTAAVQIPDSTIPQCMRLVRTGTLCIKSSMRVRDAQPPRSNPGPSGAICAHLTPVNRCLSNHEAAASVCLLPRLCTRLSRSSLFSRRCLFLHPEHTPYPHIALCQSASNPPSPPDCRSPPACLSTAIAIAPNPIPSQPPLSLRPLSRTLLPCSLACKPHPAQRPSLQRSTTDPALLLQLAPTLPSSPITALLVHPRCSSRPLSSALLQSPWS